MECYNTVVEQCDTYDNGKKLHDLYVSCLESYLKKDASKYIHDHQFEFL